MRTVTKQLLAAATLALTWQPIQAATVIPVTPPADSTSNVVFGINDDNVIAGRFFDAAGIEHGFVGPLNGAYTVFDLGGTSFGTEPRAIGDDGSINGFAPDANFGTGQEFLRLPNGTIGPITRNGVTLDGVAQGLTRRVQGPIVSVGDYLDDTFTSFLGYLATQGNYTRDVDLHLPNVANTHPRAINKDGTIAGFVDNAAGVRHGFIKKGSRVQIINADDTGTTVIEGLNNDEFAAGQVVDELGQQHSFTYDNVTGEFKTIVIDDASTFQQAWGVNNARLVAVSTSIGSSYIYCQKPASRCPTGGFEVPDGALPRNGRDGVTRVAPAIQ